jgi:hypothetical protein
MFGARRTLRNAVYFLLYWNGLVETSGYYTSIGIFACQLSEAFAWHIGIFLLGIRAWSSGYWLKIITPKFYTNKGEDYRKNCRNWRTCVSENLPTFHTYNSPVSETSPYRVNIFPIKWSLKANLVGRIHILFIVTFRNFWVSCVRRFKVPCLIVRLNRPIGIFSLGYYSSIGIFRLNRPIGISCEVISPSGYTSIGIFVISRLGYWLWQGFCLARLTPKLYSLRFLVGSMYGIIVNK